MRELQIAVAALLLSFVLSAPALAQTSNATLGGTVTNTQTGIVTTVVSSEAGAYQFASLQTGIYRVSAELPGFPIQIPEAMR